VQQKEQLVQERETQQKEARQQKRQLELERKMRQEEARLE
jgi:hypothetical protein